jgi:peptide/nickel transport system permease protein
MIAMGFQNVVTGQWWPSIFPGMALALTVFGLGRIGASIQAWSNPRERARPSPRAWAAFRRLHAGDR